jgi:hypothetical protein
MASTIIGISTKPKEDGTYTCTIPVDSLEQDGTPPEENDSVSFQVDGTVQSIDGDDATIKVTAVNGEPVGETPEEENAEDQDNTGNGGGGNSPGLAAMRKNLGGSGPPPGMAGMT